MNMLASIDMDCRVSKLMGLLAQLPPDALVTIADNGCQLVIEWQLEPLTNPGELR